jgi:hypothetical protein
MIAARIGVIAAIGGLLAGIASLRPRRWRRRPAAEPSRAAQSAPLDARDAVLARLVRLAATVTGTDRGALFLRADERVGGAVAVAVTGQPGGLLGLAGVVLRSGSATVVGEGGPAAAVPVVRHGEVDAALVVARGEGEIEPQDVERLVELGALCAAALDHAESYDEAVDGTEPQARALQTAAAVWDGHPPSRDDLVARLAEAIGRSMGMAEADLHELELAGRLHDVGKLRVPGNVLRRAGPLTEAEWSSVRMHPVWSAELVSRVPGLEAVAGLVRLHHERIDGRGYPDALPAARIPLGARILAVCDAYAALRSDRPYRAALSIEEAVAELRGATGQFDPDVVRALEDHLERAPTYA